VAEILPFLSGPLSPGGWGDGELLTGFDASTGVCVNRVAVWRLLHTPRTYIYDGIYMKSYAYSK